MTLHPFFWMLLGKKSRDLLSLFYSLAPASTPRPEENVARTYGMAARQGYVATKTVAHMHRAVTKAVSL